MRRQQSVVDIGFKVLNGTHRAVLRLSGGRIAGSAFGMPVVELRTVGRKSGLTRVTVLTSPIHDEDRVVLVASKGGDARDPQWYENLKVHPDVEVLINGRTIALRARTASVDEKATLWPQIVGVYKGYHGYQDKADRNIPVVICERRPASRGRAKAE
jgi:deazaflavin-dependent oxidoreductase (nitroreductase family)